MKKEPSGVRLLSRGFGVKMTLHIMVRFFDNVFVC